MDHIFSFRGGLLASPAPEQMEMLTTQTRIFVLLICVPKGLQNSPGVVNPGTRSGPLLRNREDEPAPYLDRMHTHFQIDGNGQRLVYV